MSKRVFPMLIFAAACAATPARPVRVVNPSDVTFKLNDADLDPDGKFKRDGDMIVSGLFYKEGQPVELAVHVHVEEVDGKVVRKYPIEIPETSLGASADVRLDDGALLSVSLPRTPGEKGDFKVEPEKVAATVMRSPDGPQLTACLIGRDVFQGGLRFVACGLNPGSKLSFGFIDDAPRTPAAAPPEPDGKR